MEEDMAIRIEQNLFYVESKGLSLILENRDGYLMLKHLDVRSRLIIFQYGA